MNGISMGTTSRRRTTSTLILVFFSLAAVWNMKRYQSLHPQDTALATSKVAVPNKSSSRSSWSSPHLLDCREMLNDVDDVSKGNLFVTTTTEPSFQMSIHSPEQDAISKQIRKHGCWECGHIQEMVQVLSLYPDSYLLDIGGNIGM